MFNSDTIVFCLCEISLVYPIQLSWEELQDLLELTKADPGKRVLVIYSYEVVGFNEVELNKRDVSIRGFKIRLVQEMIRTDMNLKKMFCLQLERLKDVATRRTQQDVINKLMVLYRTNFAKSCSGNYGNICISVKANTKEGTYGINFMGRPVHRQDKGCPLTLVRERSNLFLRAIPEASVLRKMMLLLQMIVLFYHGNEDYNYEDPARLVKKIDRRYFRILMRANVEVYFKKATFRSVTGNPTCLPLNLVLCNHLKEILVKELDVSEMPENLKHLISKAYVESRVAQLAIDS